MRKSKLAKQPPSLEECKIRNGVDTDRRVLELLEAAQKGDDSFKLEQARSLGSIEGAQAFIIDLMQKFVVPTLQNHEGRITANRWWLYGTLVFCTALATCIWCLGKMLIEKLLLH